MANTELSYVICYNFLSSKAQFFQLWRYKVTSGHFKKSGGVAEDAWASKYFIQIKSLKEVVRLESEIVNRLRRIGVVPQIGGNKVLWEEHESALILKVRQLLLFFFLLIQLFI